MGVTLNPGTLLNGNGIDVNSLVTASLAPMNAQVTNLQQQQSGLQTQSSLLTSMNNDLSSLASAVNSLNDVLGPLSAMSAQSSQSSIVTASAQPGAAAGSHTVVVSTLATQGTIYTNAVPNANTSLLPTGVQSADLSFQVGGSGGATHDITISAGTNDTLTKLVSFINKQNWGVTASVLTDATGARLAIYSNNTGSAGALAIANNTTNLSFNTPVGGTNASFTVDGIPFSSSSNTVTGAIPNVNLNLVGAYSGVQVQVSVGQDASQAEQAISAFVSAYNTVVADLNTQFTFNSTTNSEGPLAGDNALRSLQSSLLGDVTFAPAASTVYTNSVKTGTTSILPTGQQSADLQIQIGGSSGTTHDIAISAGTNDTPNSLASYINQQSWGVTANVISDANGAHLNLSSSDRGSSGVVITNNTTNLTFNTAAGSAFANLDAMGISMNDDGTLNVNSAKLSSALSTDPTSVLNFFQNAAQTGFANNFSHDLLNLTDPTRGILSVDLKQNQATQQDLSNSILDLQDQISAMQQQLQTEYSQVQALLESFPYQLQAVQMELGITPTNSSNTVTGAG